MQKNNKYSYVPFYVSLGVVLGILIGSFYANQYSQKFLSIIDGSGNKLSDLLYIIEDQYVDPVQMNEIVEKALPQILRELDPHSVYISAAESEQAMQNLNGSFSGIGIQFFQLDDTVRIVRVIPGGPSDGSGLQAGDCILASGKKSLVGKDIPSDTIMKYLKGETGSTASLTIKRRGTARPFNVSVVRGSVPLHSVSASYMLDETTGYISIGNFGETTYAEFLAALARLNRHDFQQLVIDLRGNLGGYMAPAIQIANEFLTKGCLIVYTEGRKSPREEFRSDGRGSYQQMPLVVLIDESSASASEILAAALQDNDRATIIGRRSFGKGLVQVPIALGDGSMIRLTKARYYAPSGRCLQKPYTPGDETSYEMDLLQRMEHGEFYNSDSIKATGKKYLTTHGRVVYGGGGVTPDIFVPMDTAGVTSYFKEAYQSGNISRFCFHYVDNHRADFASIQTNEEITKYLRRKNLPELFATYAERRGQRRRNLMLKQSRQLFEHQIWTGIINDAFSPERAIEFGNTFDPVVLKAIDVIKRGDAFPRK